MSKFKKYSFNPETLLYEIELVSAKSRFMKTLILLGASVGLFMLFFWIATEFLGIVPPKTRYLRSVNARWVSKIEVLNRRLDDYDATLEGLALRDNDVYRNVFGMNTISADERNAGFGGTDRYAYLDIMGSNSLLKSTTQRVDVLTKKTYIQSKSFDEISLISKRAGDVASCIPAIMPVHPASDFRLTSSFGYRSDPINGNTKMHTGFDFASKPGNPIYATGAGVVESVNFDMFGYGNSVIVDHGFGYKTRYAHMKDVYVVEGMKLMRGECIGLSGNTGRSTGPHLHYEVFYKGRFVNPYNYFDLNMDPDEYTMMVEKVAQESDNVMIPRGSIKSRMRKLRRR